MAEWIKMELHLPEKPEVLQIAEATKMDPDLVVGKLFKIWGWATRNCNADGVTHIAALSHLNILAGHSGFAESMVEAGWLRIKDAKITFPNFDRHCSQTAKERALATRRKAKERCHAYVTQMSRSLRDRSVTRIDKNKSGGGAPAAAPSCL